MTPANHDISPVHTARPGTVLRDSIAYYWEIDTRGLDPHQLQPMAPSPYLDIIFPLEGLLEMNRSEHLTMPFYNTFTLAAQLLRFSGDTRIFGIRIHPECAPALVKSGTTTSPASAVPLDAVLHEKFSRMLTAEIRSASSFENRVRAAERILPDLLRPSQNESHTLMRYMCTEFRHHDPPSLSMIAEETGYTTRWLQKLSKKHLGVPPKTLQRIIRLNNCLHAAAARFPATNLTKCAHEYGYFDQAHFIKETRAFTGKNPRTLLHPGHWALRSFNHP